MTDVRILRSKRVIKSALVSLINEKGFENVTALEVAKKAGVNRSTIYLHYSSLEKILYEIEEEIINDLLRSAFALTGEDFSSYINKLALLILTQKERIKAVLSSSYSHFLKKIETALMPLISLSPYKFGDIPEAEEKFIMTFLVDGAIGVIDAYLKSYDNPTNEDVAALVRAFISFFRDPVFSK